MDIKLKTGAVTYNIKDEDDEIIGTIKLYPGDFMIADRFEEVKKNIMDLKTDEVQSADALRKLSNYIIEQMDYLTGTDTRKTIFAKQSPLAIMENGEFYLKGVLSVLDAILAKEMQKRADKLTKALADIKGE